ncbi:MAG: GNAT family N-acetyltransferase [Usitatibacter sp.]
MTEESRDEIRHEDDGLRGAFYIERDGKRVAELTYSMAGNAAVVDLTWVEPRLRGGTLASSLVKAAVEWARAGDRKIVPACSYVRSVFARTTEYNDVRG